VAPAARQDVPDRHRAGPHHRRRRAEAAARRSKPYKEWIKRIRIKLDDLPAGAARKPSSAARVDVPLLDRQQAFGYTQEDVKLLMEPMALQGEEAIGSMGNDAALPCCRTGPGRF